MTDSNRIADMGDLLARMNAAVEGRPIPRRSVGIPDDGGKAHMGRILEAFRGAIDETADTAENPHFALALTTEKTDTGVKMGNWLIETKQDGKKKYYDVTNVVSGDCIVRDFRLYEAAEKLVSSLNEGLTINSSKVRAILEAEGNYCKHIIDAAKFARKMKITEGASYDIAEARYLDARSKAVAAKSDLNDL